MIYLTAQPGDAVVVRVRAGAPEQVHVFDEASILAVNAALAARRPLLVRGEPGCGKTQLARAVAVRMKRVFLSHVVDSHTEPRDLLWTFDAVARLAEAQVQGALRGAVSDDSLRERLEIANFIVPGPLWWAFAWDDAKKQAERTRRAAPPQPAEASPSAGAVVLIDEIDKAESDVPNGLLEALGDGQFTPEGRTASVKAQGIPPLVVVTTNEERGLPDAFLRRCLVLHLALPRGDAIVPFLVARGRAHFAEADESVLVSAAQMLAEDRELARKQNLSLPGQAEYLDLVRAVLHLAHGDVAGQQERLERVRRFTLRKHPEIAGE